MTISIVQIWSMALRHVGNATDVKAVNELSANANACRLFYDACVDETLESFAWPFAKKTVALGLVQQNPTTEWAFSYRYPSDCLAINRILGLSGAFSRNPTRSDRISYLIGGDDTGLLIYTDMSDAVVEYTARITDVTHFPSSFIRALSLLLASYIAPSVTGGDPSNLGSKALQRWQQAILTASASAANEEQPDPEPDSEFIESRGASGWTTGFPPVWPGST